MRRNVVRMLASGEELFPSIIGYEKSVVPGLVNALLSRHDFILLGLRGQAKSRLVRMLPTLLDEWVPEVEGSEIHDDPLDPVSKYARDLIHDQGDETPVSWLHRSARYGEKLATPDTSIADLIGDIDPIKAATRKLTYADEEVIHFGIIPRTHRGIFAINELPDLQPRIQVGLLNVMEEQDVQIRGFNVRLPLDVLMVFTANPEDYTNRGSIITPLKDRIDSQILTHYPREIEIGVEITRQEAWQDRQSAGGVSVRVPHVFREIVEELGLRMPRARTVNTVEEGFEFLEKIGLPAILRPAFTLGGSGGGVAYNREEFEDLLRRGLAASRIDIDPPTNPNRRRHSVCFKLADKARHPLWVRRSPCIARCWIQRNDIHVTHQTLQ